MQASMHIRPIWGPKSADEAPDVAALRRAFLDLPLHSQQQTTSSNLKYTVLQAVITGLDAATWEQAWDDLIFGNTAHAFWKQHVPAELLQICTKGIVATFLAASWPLEPSMALKIAAGHAMQVFSSIIKERPYLMTGEMQSQLLLQF